MSPQDLIGLSPVARDRSATPAAVDRRPSRVRVSNGRRACGAACGSALSSSPAMDLSPHDIAYAPTTGVRRLHVTPLVEATEKSLAGYGALVTDPRTFPIEIVRWPARG